MAERFLHHLQTVELPESLEEESARIRQMRAELGARQTRRMSPLGMCLTAVLAGQRFDDDPAVVYATTHTETGAIEKYIDSFPHASPLLFQMSIHPGGIQQALIARLQPVTELFPLAGNEGILSQALRIAFTTGRPRCVWCGGEERGTWLRTVGKASARTFAWSLSLDRDPVNAEARVEWTPEATGKDAPMTTRRWIEILRDRQNAEWADQGSGRFAWRWS